MEKNSYIYYFNHKVKQSGSERKHVFFRQNDATELLLLAFFFFEKAEKVIQTWSKIVSHVI